MVDLRVATWTIHRRRKCLDEALADSTVDVLAAQEVPIGRRNKDFPGNRNYWKLWGGGRGAMYINKR